MQDETADPVKGHSVNLGVNVERGKWAGDRGGRLLRGGSRGAGGEGVLLRGPQQQRRRLREEERRGVRAGRTRRGQPFLWVVKMLHDGRPYMINPPGRG